MTAVSFEEVSKRFRIGRPWGLKDQLLGSQGYRHRSKTIRAVNDLSFSVQEGEAMALLGHNGSGKSTTLKLLAGTITPSEGVVRTNGRIAPLLELGAGFHPDLTGRENLFLNAAVLGVRRSFVKRHFTEIVEFAGLEQDIDRPVRFYSSGMNARLGFAIAVNVEPEILILDEVLAVGDAEFQSKCLERMTRLRDEGRTIILVTHSLTQAQAFCHRGLVLHSGSLVFDGSIHLAGEAFTKSTRCS
jgi:ABC-2 type transport system ATP-binding protein